MAHFQNQHDPKPDDSIKTIRLADDQFDKLVELLTPGYHLSVAYFEQAIKNAHPVAEVEPEIESSAAEEERPAVDEPAKSEPFDE